MLTPFQICETLFSDGSTGYVSRYQHILEKKADETKGLNAKVVGRMISNNFLIPLTCCPNGSLQRNVWKPVYYSDSGHLVADKLKDLHRFAEIIGMENREGFYSGKKPRRYYTFPDEATKERAIRNGAVKVRPRTLLMLAQRLFVPRTKSI